VPGAIGWAPALLPSKGGVKVRPLPTEALRRFNFLTIRVRRVMLKPYFIAASKGKPPRTAETVDVAARHLLYKLYDATSRVPGAWHALGEIGERSETVARAVERGWIIVRERDSGGRVSKMKSAALTDEGRRVARKGLWG
jgi:hypothetical protein